MIIIIMIIILITIIIKTIMIILTVIITIIIIIITIIIITIIMIIIIIINYHSHHNHHHFIINVPVETCEQEGGLSKCFNIFLHITNFSSLLAMEWNRICLKTETIGFLSQLSKQARQTVSNS